jgi:hypothetical protein
MAELSNIRETVRQKYAKAAEAAARGEFKQARAIERLRFDQTRRLALGPIAVAFVRRQQSGQSR